MWSCDYCGMVASGKWQLPGNLGFVPIRSLPGINQCLGVRVGLQLIYYCVPSLPPTTLALLPLLSSVSPFQKCLFPPFSWWTLIHSSKPTLRGLLSTTSQRPGKVSLPYLPSPSPPGHSVWGVWHESRRHGLRQHPCGCLLLGIRPSQGQSWGHSGSVSLMKVWREGVNKGSWGVSLHTPGLPVSLGKHSGREVRYNTLWFWEGLRARTACVLTSLAWSVWPWMSSSDSLLVWANPGLGAKSRGFNKGRLSRDRIWGPAVGTVWVPGVCLQLLPVLALGLEGWVWPPSEDGEVWGSSPMHPAHWQQVTGLKHKVLVFQSRKAKMSTLEISTF